MIVNVFSNLNNSIIVRKIVALKVISWGSSFMIDFEMKWTRINANNKRTNLGNLQEKNLFDCFFH